MPMLLKYTRIRYKAYYIFSEFLRVSIFVLKMYKVNTHVMFVAKDSECYALRPFDIVLVLLLVEGCTPSPIPLRSGQDFRWWISDINWFCNYPYKFRIFNNFFLTRFQRFFSPSLSLSTNKKVYTFWKCFVSLQNGYIFSMPKKMNTKILILQKNSALHTHKKRHKQQIYTRFVYYNTNLHSTMFLKKQQSNTRAFIKILLQHTRALL